MNLSEVFHRRTEPRWMNQRPPAYGYGGNSPRTEMRVIMCCNKCEEKVREEVSEVYGVEEIFSDQARSEVVVYGYADSHDVLKKAKKVDKRANIMSTDSFTLHYGKHNKHHKHGSHDKYNRGHFSDYNRGHTYNGRDTRYPIEVASSPRYNSSLNQSSRFNLRSGSIDMPDYNRYRQSDYRLDYRPEPEYRQSDYRLDYRPEPEYRHRRDGYRSEPESRYRYNDYRSMYNDDRLEMEHAFRYNGYRPSQNYAPSYLERDFQDSLYPETIINPGYMKQMEFY